MNKKEMAAKIEELAGELAACRAELLQVHSITACVATCPPHQEGDTVTVTGVKSMAWMINSQHVNHMAIAAKIEGSMFRIHSFHWLAALLQDELENEIEDVFEDFEVKEAAEVFGLDVHGDADDAIEPYELADQLREARKFGFFAVVHIPRQHFTSETQSTWSWGRCFRRHVYGETLDEVIAKAEELARETGERDKLKFTAALTASEPVPAAAAVRPMGK